jgi:lipopolysaccharide exporter
MAPLIAAFYKVDRLVGVFRLLSINFLIIPINSISFNLLHREMRFGALFKIGILSTITSFAISVGLASLGFGYISLVWSSLASTLVVSLTVSIFRRGEMFYRPTLIDWKKVLSFSSKITLTNFTSVISSNSNDLILGRILGFAQTGIVSRAQGIMYLFHRNITGAIRGVAFPAFSKAHRENRNLEEDFIKAVTVLTVFAWPFYGFFSLYPVEALRLFGPQWDDAGPLVLWFCAGGAVMATCSLIPTILPALGGGRYLVRLHVDPLRVLTFAIVIYIFRTSEAFAITFLVFCILSTPLVFYLKDKVLPTHYKALMAGLLKSLIASAFALVIPALLAGWIYAEASGYLQYLKFPKNSSGHHA